jgi:dTDP-glucose 4,6-dehydratase
MAKNVLVTGGAGFIGSNYVEYHLKTFPEDKVIVYDKLTYAGRPENVKEFEDNPNYVFVKGDIMDAEMVAQTLKDQDVHEVVHFAAESHVDRSIEGQRVFLETNVLGTYTLLEESRKQGIEKFVAVGTDEVYGSVETGESKEGDELQPRNPYSASKAGSDRLAYSYFATYGMQIMMTRGSNTYGPKHFPEKVIPLFITNLMEGKKVPLYGDGKNIRDWLYVTDHCAGVATVLRKGKAGEAYNIPGNKELQNVELTHAILKALDKDESMIEYVEDRKGHDRRYAMDGSKLRALGWDNTIQFEEGLQKTIQWYKENEAWWKPLKE